MAVNFVSQRVLVNLQSLWFLSRADPHSFCVHGSRQQADVGGRNRRDGKRVGGGGVRRGRRAEWEEGGSGGGGCDGARQ